jgi:tRNA threonylcarbamoyladenosine modification (KEOPS) complex  Pcc1 subunit
LQNALLKALLRKRLSKLEPAKKRSNASTPFPNVSPTNFSLLAFLLEDRVDSGSGDGMLKTSAVVRLEYPSKRHLEIFLRALKPEVAKPATMRSNESLRSEGKSLVLYVEASDTVALRVALNAYLRWISSITNVLDVVKTQELI